VPRCRSVLLISGSFPKELQEVSQQVRHEEFLDGRVRGLQLILALR
jgi:hypothetical protein